MNSNAAHSMDAASLAGGAHRPILSETRLALANAIFRAMQVAGEPENGYPSKLGQEALAERAGIARSTVAKYLSAKDTHDSIVNPDLETVCKLATALNIPPAFLLMTPSDWSKLAQAAADAVVSSQDSIVKNIVSDLERNRIGASRRGEACLRLAERLGVRSRRNVSSESKEPIPVRWQEAQSQVEQRSEIGILCATALPPIDGITTEQKTILLSLCAILGASTNLK